MRFWHKPKWVGRGLKRHWQEAKWQIIPVENLPTIKP